MSISVSLPEDRENRPILPEQWLAAIVESSDDAILSMSLSGQISSWNAAATRIFGYDLKEVIGQPVNMLAWPGEEERIETFLETLRKGGKIDHMEVSRRHKNGARLILSVSYSPIIDPAGNIIGISKIARDLTERIAESQALESSRQQLTLLTEQESNARAQLFFERKFRELIENAPDAIFQIDPKGLIVITNRTAQTMFGYPPEELIGKSVDQLVPEANRSAHPGHRKSFANAGLTRPMGLGLDLFARRKDASKFPVEISLSPLKTDTGVHVIAVVRDVTERKQTEQRVRNLQESYMTELEARHKEAERLNQLKSEFMASISHELRTPLHTIIGFSELLEEEGEGPLNDKQKRFLNHIHTDSEHLLGLINDVLDLSRIEAGGLHLRTETLSLRDLVSESVNAIRPYADGKSVAIRVDEPMDLNVWADSMRLRQILYNLLSNGAKFTEPGGEVTVSAIVDGEFVKITVADTGLGIPTEECTRIFDKFYQVGFTPVGVREGTGLGLAICRQLVEMQKGSIWVESEPGVGSQFHFTLPHNQM